MVHRKFQKPSSNSPLFNNFGWNERSIWSSNDDSEELAELASGLLDPLLYTDTSNVPKTKRKKPAPKPRDDRLYAYLYEFVCSSIS